MSARSTPWLAIAAIGVLALGVSGCADDTADSDSSGSTGLSSAQVDSPDLRAQKAAAGIEACPDVGTSAGPGGLPDVTLPCLGGGPDVNLSAIPGPAIVNLWATYCGPCRSEAPIFEQAHQQLGDRVSVIGVDYQEPQPGRALAFADELGLTYPQLSDPEALLRADLRVQGLPKTLLIDSDGVVTPIPREIESDDELAGLLSEHLGIDDDWADAS